MATKPQDDAVAAYDERVAQLHDAFVATARQADAARLLALPHGKSLRDATRAMNGTERAIAAGFTEDKGGTYVSRGAIWPGALAELTWAEPYTQRAVVALLGPRPVAAPDPN